MKVPEFPRAILHVDGDYFFVSCELASRPWLKSKPVITGHERGIATAMNPLAKKLGVTRGMPVFKIRKQYPQVVILHSDYDSYELYARRMYTIVRRYTPIVEEYSIDECFADITDSPARLNLSYEEIARAIKRDLEVELGLSFSVGVSVNKVTAKIASKWAKPSGLTIIPKNELPNYLAKLPISKVWGVGRSTSVMLRKLGIESALQLVQKNREWIESAFAKPVRELYEELQGNYVHQVESTSASKEDQISISRTRTFTPASTERAFIYAQLAKNVELACARLRSHGYFARWMSFFLKTQEFTYHRIEVKLPTPVATPEPILAIIHKRFNEICREGIRYRASGITLGDLTRSGGLSLSLFESPEETSRFDQVHEVVDELAYRYGEGSVFLASSWRARKGERVEPRHLNIPFLGFVTDAKAARLPNTQRSH